MLARCYFEVTEIDCAIDQLKPGLKSMAQYFSFLCYLKGSLDAHFAQVDMILKGLN